MKRIISILMTVVTVVSCMVVLSITADAADQPVVTDVNNYTVNINGITGIKEIRFAVGRYHYICNHFREALRDAAAELSEAGFSKAKEMEDRILRAGGYARL